MFRRIHCSPVGTNDVWRTRERRTLLSENSRATRANDPGGYSRVNSADPSKFAGPTQSLPFLRFANVEKLAGMHHALSHASRQIDPFGSITGQLAHSNGSTCSARSLKSWASGSKSTGAIPTPATPTPSRREIRTRDELPPPLRGSVAEDGTRQHRRR
jgi:hypothetical protein